MSFKRPIIPSHIQCSYIFTWRNSPCFFSPLAGSPLFPFVSPSTYLAPSSCDRNRPPRSQVACKLTPFAPPFTRLSHPFQIPEPQLPSALLRRPREYSGSCYPEQLQSTRILNVRISKTFRSSVLVFLKNDSLVCRLTRGLLA
jgi:hypothetical protein